MKCLDNKGKKYELIYRRGSRTGILYGSPKFHKPVINNCPKFCSILSAIGTPANKFDKFLVCMLPLLRVNEFFGTFSDEVSSFCLDHFIASLDVKSLFTNIPLMGLLTFLLIICFVIPTQFIT